MSESRQNALTAPLYGFWALTLATAESLGLPVKRSEFVESREIPGIRSHRNQGIEVDASVAMLEAISEVV